MTGAGSRVRVVEVSVTSLRRDLDRKPALYARAGVEECWLVVVHRGPGAGAGGYAEVFAVAPGERIVGAAAGLPALDVGAARRRRLSGRAAGLCAGAQHRG